MKNWQDQVVGLEKPGRGDVTGFACAGRSAFVPVSVTRASRLPPGTGACLERGRFISCFQGDRGRSEHPSWTGHRSGMCWVSLFWTHQPLPLKLPWKFYILKAELRAVEGRIRLRPWALIAPYLSWTGPSVMGTVVTRFRRQWHSGCPQSQACIAQVVTYLIRGVSMETKEKQCLMIGTSYKPVSEIWDF